MKKLNPFTRVKLCFPVHGALVQNLSLYHHTSHICERFTRVLASWPFRIIHGSLYWTKQGQSMYTAWASRPWRLVSVKGQLCGKYMFSFGL